MERRAHGEDEGDADPSTQQEDAQPGDPILGRGEGLAGHDDVRAISDRDGRVLVVMTHNTDFGDAFEREGDSRAYFERFAGAGYAFGVNTLLYAMTH